MFDVGFWELALIFLVGLMILGPKRLPRVASQIGRWVGRARRTAISLRRQLEQEIATADAPPPKRKPTHIKPVNSPAATKDEEDTGGDDAELSVDASADETEAAPAATSDALPTMDEEADKDAGVSAGGS